MNPDDAKRPADSQTWESRVVRAAEAAVNRFRSRVPDPDALVAYCIDRLMGREPDSLDESELGQRSTHIARLGMIDQIRKAKRHRSHLIAVGRVRETGAPPVPFDDLADVMTTYLSRLTEEDRSLLTTCVLKRGHLAEFARARKKPYKQLYERSRELQRELRAEIERHAGDNPRLDDWLRSQGYSST